MNELKLVREHEKDEDIEHRVWVVVASGGKSYMGQTGFPADMPLPEFKNTLLNSLRDEFIALVEAYELIIDSPLIPQPGGMGKVDIHFLRPVNNCLHGARLYLLATGIQFFDDMTEDDQARNKKMVDELQQQLMAARMQESGIVMAPAGGIPVGKRPG